MSELLNAPAPRLLLRIFESTERDPDGGCWIWTGYCNPEPKPYGRMRVNGKLECAHRIVYKAFAGPIPEGLTLDHLCRNHRCVNPGHLEPVTSLENIRRGTQGWQQRAKTHCPQGHAYDEANTHINKRGQRMCRTCSRDRARERRRKQA